MLLATAFTTAAAPQASGPAAGDPAAGATAFRMCASCHQVGPSARSVFGPQLNGVIGRRAGALADYAYSPAMRKSGIVWNEQALTRFLRDPDDAVPGTKMRLWGIGDERKIANLLAYLRQYPPAK